MMQRLYRFATFAACLLTIGASPDIAFGDLIDFETFTGPSTFGAAGNAQTLTIPTSIGDVVISGGVILTDTSNLPADETSIYGTAGNASNIGVTTGSGFTNPITITFPEPVVSFSLDLLNGNVQTVTYQLSDNMGHVSTMDVAPNLSSGSVSFGLAGGGNVISLSAITGQSTPDGLTFDFFIDNIRFEAVPEPSSLVLAAVGVVGAFGWGVARRRAPAAR